MKISQQQKSQEKNQNKYRLDLEMEKALRDKGFFCICGVDEVGRGPWAGPITACAVIVFNDQLPIFELGIRDSKKLTPKKREELFEMLTNSPDIEYSIAWISAPEIDRIGLGVANQLVLKKAIEGLRSHPDYALVDGFGLKDTSIPNEKVIKGDEKVLSIAYASIIAKVSRDRYMDGLADKYPDYGFEEHKGYGTVRHRQALEKFGICPEHRTSFQPIKEIKKNQNTK